MQGSRKNKYQKSNDLKNQNTSDRDISMSDRNFIIEMENGNEEALRYAIEKYGGLVRAVIGKHLYLLKEEQAECFDDVFMNVWEHIGSFDKEQSTFKNWIAGIARYKSIDYLRRHRNQPELVPLNGTEDAVDDKLSALAEHEISDETDKLLKCLKPEDRSMFEKLFIEEMTVEEVSRSFQTSKDVIYKRISRARKRMRALFPERAL